MNQIILLTEENAIAPEVLAEALRWFGHMGIALVRVPTDGQIKRARSAQLSLSAFRGFINDKRNES